MRHLLFILILICFTFATLAEDLRKVSSSSCKGITVNLGLGTTTQIVLEQEPKTTLFADKKHFKIVTNPTSPRSLAIIPTVEGAELDVFREPNGKLPGGTTLASSLDHNFNTDLFVFFENNNQLLFHLHFVDKEKADKILKVTQTFSGDCAL